MTNLKKGTTLTLTTELIEMCQKSYQTENTSEAITNALTDFLLLPYKEQTLSTFANHQLSLNFEARNTTQKIALRLDENLRQIMKELAGQNTLSKTAQLMISQTLYAMRKGVASDSCPPLLYILGNKRNPKMQDAIKNIRETAQNVNWQTSVEPCVGVLGIYANFTFAYEEIMNDNDWMKINLYRAIQKDPRRLVILARTLKVDETTFDEQKNLLENTEKSKQIDYEAAAAYLYLNRNSYLHCGTSLYSNASNVSYYKVLSAIKPLHLRMNAQEPFHRATQFQNMDLLKIIKKYRGQKNVLFVTDPPYLDTDLYNKKEEKFSEKDHEKLAKLLYLVKQNDGNDFIYFCRITASKKDQRRPNAEEWNCHMKGRIDDLYYGRGFYYIDVPLEDNVIERIITSFPFEGATFYGKGCD